MTELTDDIFKFVRVGLLDRNCSPWSVATEGAWIKDVCAECQCRVAAFHTVQRYFRSIVRGAGVRSRNRWGDQISAQIIDEIKDTIHQLAIGVQFRRQLNAKIVSIIKNFTEGDATST